jgi:hypothetical protein
MTVKKPKPRAVRTIKPCPFCGSKASMSGGFVSCDDLFCCACGPDGADEADAIAKWNKRKVKP